MLLYLLWLTPNRYNAAIVSVQPANAFVWILVTPDFVAGAPYDVTTANQRWPFRDGSPLDYTAKLADLHRHFTLREGLSNLTAEQCLRQHMQGFSNASDVLLVTSSSQAVNASNNSLLTIGYSLNPYDGLGNDFCGDLHMALCRRPDSSDTQSISERWSMRGHHIDYCLSRTRTLDDKCSLIVIFPVMFGKLFSSIAIGMYLVEEKCANLPFRGSGHSV